MNKLIGMLADVTSIGDIILDTYNIVAIKKQNKLNRNVVIGAHIAVSVLAVGVSAYQTASLKKKIEESIKKGQG